MGIERKKQKHGFFEMIPKRQMQLKTTAFEITYLVLNAAHIFVYLYICIILSPVLATINNSGAAAVCHSKVGRNYSSTKLCLHSSLVKYVTSGWYKHTRVLVPLIITNSSLVKYGTTGCSCCKIQTHTYLYH